jgi:hypothetical protein
MQQGPLSQEHCAKQRQANPMANPVDYREADPNPGIGGYDYPRGPYGATGYAGSTTAVRENPPEAEGKLRDDYTGRYPRRRWHTFQSQQEYQIPSPAEYGSLPYHDGPVNPDEVRHTEIRNHQQVSGGIPGGERQRNTIYRGGLQAKPGLPDTRGSAPNPGIQGHHSRAFAQTQEVTVETRYKYNGPDGGTDLYQDTLTDRRMPYVGQHGYRGIPGYPLGHARGSVRGAVLDGARYFQAPGSELNVGAQGGAYGQRVRGHQRHRPTIFREPAPWTENFYDSTDSVGSADAPGTNRHQPDAVLYSPHVKRRNRGF